MKKSIFTVIFMMICVQFTFAQATVQAIRERYNQQQIEITHMNNGDQPKEWYQVKVQQNRAGTGAHEEDVRMYYRNEYAYDEGDVEPNRRLAFITVSYNFAAAKFYEEYLFDDKGNLSFAYAHIPAWAQDTEYEARCYFNAGKLMQLSVKGRRAGQGEYKEVYSGSSIPQDYQGEYQKYLDRVAQYKKLFASVDAATCR